jgi:hypothetical protein
LQKPGNLMTTPKAVCKNFCSYYKPEKAEDLACRGFTIIQRLMREGRRISLERRDTVIGPAVSELLSENVCPSCPFREDGCDFADGREGAQPCGGFLLLGHLIGTGVLDVDDL